jgi:hypothetical protein
MSVADRDQLLGPVDPHTDDDQDTEACLFEAYVEVDAIDPDVNEVGVFERAAGELVPFALPVGREPGDDGSREPGGRAEELRKGRGEVARAHPVQVHQREHLGHLGGLSSPGRQDRTGEAHLLPSHLIDPAIVDAWGPDLKGSGPGDQRSWLGVPVAHDQAVSVLVALFGETRYVGVYLGFEGGGQHPASPFSHDGVQPYRQLRARGLINMYSQHRRSFLPASQRQRSCLCQTGRYAASPLKSRIHRYWL